MVELLSVAGVLSLAAWVAWRAKAAGGTARRLQVVESSPLGPGRNVAVVRAGGRCFLIGATAQGIARLAELDAEEWRAEPEPTRPVGRLFGPRPASTEG